MDRVFIRKMLSVVDFLIGFCYIISMDFKTFQQRENLTQTDIADRLSVTQATVSSWSMNRTTPTIPQIKKLIFMGMTIGEVIDAETEAFVLKGKRQNARKLAADAVETALVNLVNGNTDKITDKATCTKIVKMGIEELFLQNDE